MRRGSILIELIIAFAIFSLSMSALLILISTDRNTTYDLFQMEENIEGVRESILAAKHQSAYNFIGITSTSTNFAFLTVADISLCLKSATSSVSQQLRNTISNSLHSLITDINELNKRAGDCLFDAPSLVRKITQTVQSKSMPSLPTTLDELGGVVYIGLSQPPYFAAYVSSTTAALTPIPFTNNFTLYAPINDLDAVEIDDSISTTEHRYVFVAIASSTSQLAVIEVTNPAAPQLIATSSLKTIDPAGSFPQGWRIQYYGGKIYETTRETSGNEFHTFNASNPARPIELGSGIKLGITFNDFIVRDQWIRGAQKRFLFAATSRTSGELAVYDATDSLNKGLLPEILADRQDLPGIQNGESISLLGQNAYLGRQSTPSGADVYVYSTKDPSSNMQQIGSVDIGSSVMGLHIIGDYALLTTAKVGHEIQIWNVASSSHITFSTDFSSPGVGARALDFDGVSIYAGNANSSVQTLTPQ
jgi:hypothetical protein